MQTLQEEIHDIRTIQAEALKELTRIRRLQEMLVGSIEAMEELDWQIEDEHT